MPENGPKTFPHSISIWAVRPALLNSGGSSAISSKYRNLKSVKNANTNKMRIQWMKTFDT